MVNALHALGGVGLFLLGMIWLTEGLRGLAGDALRRLLTRFTRSPLSGALAGAAATAVIQSSSATTVTTVGFVSAGLLTFPQAAAMVIGMNVGTTFTAALATLGGTTATRRTGLSHVIYNVLTGLMAFILLTPFALLVQPLLAEGEDQIALVAFHTAFNALGVILVLPFAKQFANFVVTLVPERGPHLTRRLGSELLADQDAAMDAVAATIAEISREQFHDLADRLDTTGSVRDHPERLRAIADALTETRVFVGRLSSLAQTPHAPTASRLHSTGSITCAVSIIARSRQNVSKRCAKTIACDVSPEC